MTFYDSNGMLILPKGAAEEFASMRKKRVHTGVYIQCPRCGHVWERTVLFSREARCSACKKHLTVSPIMEVRA